MKLKFFFCLFLYCYILCYVLGGVSYGYVKRKIMKYKKYFFVRKWVLFIIVFEIC